SACPRGAVGGGRRRGHPAAHLGAVMTQPNATRARREARATVLAAHREGYETLRAAAYEAVLRLRDDPRYPQLHEALTLAARRTRGWTAHRSPAGPAAPPVGYRAGRAAAAGTARRTAAPGHRPRRRAAAGWPGYPDGRATRSRPRAGSRRVRRRPCSATAGRSHAPTPRPPA